MIAQTCLVYLLQFKNAYISITYPDGQPFCKALPLICYAAENWLDHAKAANVEEGNTLKRLSEQLFMDWDAFLKWVEVIDIDEEEGSHPLPLYYATLSGLNHILALLLHNGVNVNDQGGFYGNALQAASSSGHRDVVELLLSNGADVNAQGGEYGNVLQAALCSDHRDVVELLLSNGADVNA